MYLLLLYLSKNDLPYSKEETIIAQAGATLTSLGTTPANKPGIPF